MQDLSAFLPNPAEVPGWTPKDKPQRYQGEDLFLFIDGGAEIYHEYGFKQVLAQDYADPAGRTVALEIFEMSGDEAAFGMFTFKSSGKGRSAGLGQDSQVEDYYLNFWKGPLLVTATGFDESPASLDGVLALARATDRKIKATGRRPAGASLLPAEWAGPGLKYLKGPLGLYNLHPFFSGDVFKFREAAAGGDEAFRVFVFRYGTPAEARNRWSGVRTAFSGSSAYRNVRRVSDASFEASAPKGMTIHVETFADVIALILAPDPLPQVRDIVTRLKNQRDSLFF